MGTNLKVMVLCFLPYILAQCAMNKYVIAETLIENDSSSEIKFSVQPKFIPDRDSIQLLINLKAKNKEKFLTMFSDLAKRDPSKILENYDLDVVIYWDKGNVTKILLKKPLGYITNSGISLATVPVAKNYIGNGSATLSIHSRDKDLEQRVGGWVFQITYYSGK